MIRTNRLKVSAVLGTLILALALALAAVVLAVIANPALAITEITVTTTKDDNVTNGNCTLREAIIAANTDAPRDACPAGNGWDAIDVPAGMYLLTNGSLGEVEDNSETGDLDINDQHALSIFGAGARKTIINGYAWDRIFDVHSGSGAPDGWAEIRDLTITNGKRPTYINDGRDLSDGSSGGGVRNGSGSSLSLYRVAVTNNTADHSCRGCIGGGGGGIVNEFDGKLQLTDSTVSGNKVHSVNGGGGILSGPFPEIGAQNNTVTDIVNSTISGNSSLDTDDNHGHGGGIAISSGLTRIWDSTITNNNTAPRSGSGVDSYYDSTEVHSTLISKNANNDDVNSNRTSPSFFSAGYNLIGGGNASSAFNAEGDQTGVTDPHIGPLQNNGGSTNTHALLKDSPALNAAPNNTTECGVGMTEDQRGVKRPQNKKCDIGAYEKKRHR